MSTLPKDKDWVTIRIKAIYAAKRHGGGDWSEDFAQDALLTYCEGKSLGQSIDQTVIDVLRHNYGRKGTKSQVAKRNITKTLQINELHEQLPEEYLLNSTMDIEKVLSQLDGLERAVLVLYYKWELTLSEIGQVFGFTEGRASQLVSAATQEVQRKSRRLRTKETG